MNSYVYFNFVWLWSFMYLIIFINDNIYTAIYILLIVFAAAGTWVISSSVNVKKLNCEQNLIGIFSWEKTYASQRVIAIVSLSLCCMFWKRSNFILYHRDTNDMLW